MTTPKDRLFEVIREVLGLEPSMDSKFEDLYADPNDLREIVTQVEEEFDIEIDPDEKFETVGQLLEIIEEKHDA